MNFLKDTLDPFGLRESSNYRAGINPYTKYLQRKERIKKPLLSAVIMDEEKLKPALVSIGERAMLAERKFTHLIFGK